MPEHSQSDGFRQQEDIADKLVQQLKDQLAYYEFSAMRAQRLSLFLRLTETLIAAVLPVLILLNIQRYVVAALAMALTLLITTAQLWQFDAKWRQYRLMAEQLQRELLKFQLGTGEYSDLSQSDRTRIFAERSDNLLSSEMSRWFASQGVRRP